jgi:hypothetical protein
MRGREAAEQLVTLFIKLRVSLCLSEAFSISDDFVDVF